MEPDEEFERELEIFRWEVNAATQFFYAWLGLNSTIGKNAKVRNLLDDSALFWNTALYALRAQTFIALNIIFDQDRKSKHNIDKLLRTAQENAHIFSKFELGRRKKRASPGSWRDWLRDYLNDAYTPTPDDFRRFRRHVKKWRRIYETNYRPIRNSVFAHRSLSGHAEADPLWAKTNIREMQVLLRFLRQLHDAFWELLHNGRKPVLRPQRYSARSMANRPSPIGRRQNYVQEHMIAVTEAFLLKCAGVSGLD